MKSLISVSSRGEISGIAEKILSERSSAVRGEIQRSNLVLWASGCCVLDQGTPKSILLDLKVA